MLAAQRQDLILAALERGGAARVGELAELLGVSEMTVRRDLTILHRDGLLEKVHGGARASSHAVTAEPGFAAKSHRRLAEKEAIARHAATLVEPGSAVVVSAGTTTHLLAHHLVGIPDLTVVTNSYWVADVLYRGGHPAGAVLLTGGERTPSDALVGPLAVSTLTSMHLDVCFLGVHGMAGAGLTTPNLLESETNQAMIGAARSLVVCADSSKWGIAALSRMARLDEIDVLVTDTGLDEGGRAALEKRVGSLVLVDPSASAVRSTADE